MSASTIRSIATVFQEKKVTFLAASIAYYAFLSIIPLLLLILAIGSLLGGQAFADRIISLVEGQLSSQGATVIEEALTSPQGRGGASVASIVALAWSALKIFRGLDVAFDEVYQSDAETSLVQQIVDGLTVMGTVGLAIVLMIGLGAFVGRPTLVNIPYFNIISWIVLITGLIAVFLPFYYVLPPVDVSLSEVLPGTIFASIGWLVLQAVFQLYAANAGRYQAYGVLGAILLFLTWLYFASVLILLGAVINATLARRV